MKKIGIILRSNKSISDTLIYSVNRDLIEYLNKFDVVTINFNLSNDFNKNKELIDMCDGIILPGGSELNLNINKVLKYLVINNKPTLGICLGMQEIGCFMNGSLGHLNSYKHKSKNTYVHEVLISKDSLLHRILNRNNIMVNSRHIDYLKNTNANRVGYSKDYIVEAIEIPNMKFFLGLQWHPESLYFDNNSYKIFKYFIDIL